MQLSSRLLFRTAIVLLGIMLCLGLLLSIVAQKEAKALDSTQWETLRSYIDDYFGGQYNSAKNGEAGIRMNKVELHNRLDSTGDISPNAGAGVGSASTTVTGVLGEGDDAANRPVLIDNLRTQTAFIPGTEFRCNWNANEDCFADTSITAVREIVDAHVDAGFSTDIVVYCVSAHTAAPVTAGFGIISKVPGALSSDTSLLPNVYSLDWARNGWRNSVSAQNGANAIAAPEASAGGYSAPATTTECDSAATDYELVRCRANWAVQTVGNGQTNLTTVSGAGQSVDVRPGSISTLVTAGDNLQVPMNTLFSTSGLADLDPAKTTVVASSTQMGGQTAMGLKMLGYDMIAGGFINSGLPRWNGTIGEKQVADGDGLPLQTTSAMGAPGKVDTTGPTITVAPSAGSITDTSADISRTAAEPATMKVEYGTSPGVYTNTVNDTVLNASKTVGLSGLSPSTTYYVKVTSYDGYANGTASSEISFTTAAPPCTPAKPSLDMSMTSVYWASMADYTARELSVDLSIANSGANDADGVAITGATATGGVTLINTPYNVGTIAASSSAGVTVKFNVPMGVTGFVTNLTGSATDACDGTVYSMP